MTGGISVAVAVGKGVGEGVGTVMATGPQASDAATSRAVIKTSESPLDLISTPSNILANGEGITLWAGRLVPSRMSCRSGF